MESNDEATYEKAYSGKRYSEDELEHLIKFWSDHVPEQIRTSKLKQDWTDKGLLKHMHKGGFAIRTLDKYFLKFNELRSADSSYSYYEALKDIIVNFQSKYIKTIENKYSVSKSGKSAVSKTKKRKKEKTN